DVMKGLTMSPNSISVDYPYFEGDIGVWQAKISTDNDGGERVDVYVFMLTLDGGETWTVYDPSHLVNIESVTEFEYFDALK
ncbi:MAG: hypothetical protein IKM09_04895, partial [Clostridia bacterium]|nr:hypothetical protein [Clostridia bacterium]